MGKYCVKVFMEHSNIYDYSSYKEYLEDTVRGDENINIDAPCGGVAPNVHVRCSLFGKPKLDAAEELGPRSMHSNEIQTSGIAHSNRNAHSNFSSRGTGSCTERDPTDRVFRSR